MEILKVFVGGACTDEKFVGFLLFIGGHMENEKLVFTYLLRACGNKKLYRFTLEGAWRMNFFVLQAIISFCSKNNF